MSAKAEHGITPLPIRKTLKGTDRKKPQPSPLTPKGEGTLNPLQPYTQSRDLHSSLNRILRRVRRRCVGAADANSTHGCCATSSGINGEPTQTSTASPAHGQTAFQGSIGRSIRLQGAMYCQPTWRSAEKPFRDHPKLILTAKAEDAVRSKTKKQVSYYYTSHIPPLRLKCPGP